MSQKRNEPHFNAGAAVYDSFIFLHEPADRTVQHAGLQQGFNVLDIACGSGRASIAAAHAVGNAGKVIGVDIADKLLEVAAGKTADINLHNIEFMELDASKLPFENGSFDAVLCASSVFLFPDISAALKEWYRVLKPGGTMVLSSFGRNTFQPLLGNIDQRLDSYADITFPAPVTAVTDSEEKCRNLLRDAGLDATDVFTEVSTLPFSMPDECWRQVANSLLVRPRLNVLERSEYEIVKRDILDNLQSMITDEKIEIRVPAIYCRVIKP